ncbi:MAG: sulfatase [Candidatus Latescibacteria bacterium]|jgi:N-sulfoglucosamine sulfohydrolase|nr:sulfatase [Candidatus Latescibacterota bacterium]
MSKPNVIIITTHDTGRHFGCYGIDTVHTPAIDAIAEDGCKFTNYFTTSPVCSPSRGCMLTGRYPQSNGLIGLTHSPWDWSFNEGEQHLSHIMRDAGYHTALFGIQHESSNVDELGFESKHAQRGPGVTRTALDIAGSLADFLKSNDASDPFYAQVGFFETHRPHDFGNVESDDSKGIYVPPYLVDDATSRQELAVQQGAVRRVNDAVQIITDALKESGHEDNTILVFTVDHGIEFPRAKWFCYDPGIEIALIMRWPKGGIKDGQVCDNLLSNVDFLPTLMNLIDEPIPDNIEGISFKSVLTDSKAPQTRDAVFSVFQGSDARSVRTNRYKLIRNFAPRRILDFPVNMTNTPRSRIKLPVVELYDLEEDPNEFDNVATNPAYKEIYTELSNLLWDWMEEVDDPSLKSPIPTPYYYEAVEEYHQRKDA